MSIKNISDLKAQRGQCFISSQHGHHVLSQFGKYVFLAIITAWIYLSNGGDTLFCVLFVVEYQFTSFSLDTGIFCHTQNFIIMFITCHYVTFGKKELEIMII